MRVASQTISDNLVRQIQQLSTTQTKLQSQVSSGQRITQPEDDPASVGRVLNLQSEQRRIKQYTTNADYALDISNSSYAGLQQIKKISDRATEIATLGLGASSPDALSAYGSEVDQLIEQMVQLGNTTMGNDYIYGGTAVSTAPFTATRNSSGQVTGVTYNGNSSQISIPVSDNASISPYTDGTTNSGISDFINHLVSLRDSLNSNSTSGVSTAQAGLLTTENTFVAAIAQTGAVQTRIQVNKDLQTSRTTDITTLISNEANADLPTTVVKLSQAQTAYQAALQSAANIMQLSLLDYLK